MHGEHKGSFTRPRRLEGDMQPRIDSMEAKHPEGAQEAKVEDDASLEIEIIHGIKAQDGCEETIQHVTKVHIKTRPKRECLVHEGKSSVTMTYISKFLYLICMKVYTV